VFLQPDLEGQDEVCRLERSIPGEGDTELRTDIGDEEKKNHA
jgi:hypothetical protein